jgi:aminomethyltransferase
MGEIEIAGKDAAAAVQSIFCNDVSKLQAGKAQYSAILTDRNTFVDDVVVYRLRSDHFLVVVNAANVVKDYNWIAGQLAAFGDAVAMDATSRYALLAVQGPAAAGIVQPLTGVDLGALARYSFAHGEFANVRGTISRTGYTGEDGFEIFVPPQQADQVWRALLTSGEPVGLIPCGLGARDTLRLEAGMRLYGNDIDETTTVFEAGLEWILAASRRAQSPPPTRKLVGFELLDAGIARHGYDVFVDGQAAGRVTSGTQTPSIRKSIGMAYLPIASAAPGREFEVDIRGRRARTRVVKIPFYKR